MTCDVQTRRYVYLLISIYGTDAVKVNKIKFLEKLVEFHKVFTPELPS